MRKRTIAIAAALLMIFGLSTSIAAAAETPLIGVLTNGKKMKVLNLEGEKQGVIEMQSGNARRVLRNGSADQRAFVELDEASAGSEFVTFYSGDTLTVSAQDGTELAEMIDVFKNGKRSVIAVGDVVNDEGKEIAVCTYNTVRPKVKLYSYSSEEGITELDSFKPFGTKTKKRRGCGAMTIGDVDNDGANEIITQRHDKGIVKIFDGEGNLEHKWEGAYAEQMFVYDALGDGSNDLLIIGNTISYRSGSFTYAYNAEGQEVMNLIYNEEAGIATSATRDVHMADVDGDGYNEFVKIGTGRKGPVNIVNSLMNENERTIETFKSHPNNKNKKRKRKIVLGVFDLTE